MQKISPLLMAVTVGLTASIFSLDFFLPKGLALGTLYAVVVLVSIWSVQRTYILTIATVCSALTMLGFVLSPPAAPPWISLLNRLLALIVIWATAMLGLTRKQAERALQESEEELRQAQKMEAVGKLAGGIAHDFNNLLTIITGYSQLALNRLGLNDPIRGDIEEIKKAGYRAASLTQQLLAFSRKQVLIPKVLALNSILTAMEEMMQRLIGVDIYLVTNLDPALGRLRADPGQLEQVIMNLVINARDAMPKGGRLTIETANVTSHDVPLRGQGVELSGRYVMLAVSDTGGGMDAETQARIFEPFFTTKERGKGTGLGLSSVYGIIKQSGGHIFVQSALGKGTSVKIYLPRLEDPVEAVESEKAPADAPNGTETVLLVEDEPGVRTLVRDTLRQRGYTILEARHGIEALLINNEHVGTIHLLMTDLVMPQMSGREVANRMVSSRPDLRVLYISGHTEDAVIHHSVVNPGTAFLQKPFTPDAVARKVREVLDASPA